MLSYEGSFKLMWSFSLSNVVNCKNVLPSKLCLLILNRIFLCTLATSDFKSFIFNGDSKIEYESLIWIIFFNSIEYWRIKILLFSCFLFFDCQPDCLQRIHPLHQGKYCWDPSNCERLRLYPGEGIFLWNERQWEMINVISLNLSVRAVERDKKYFVDT